MGELSLKNFCWQIAALWPQSGHAAMIQSSGNVSTGAGMFS
jgi:hypothetical protein